MVMQLLKCKNKKGFTLIELIVVIAILAILALIAVPSLGGYLASADIRTNQANAKLMTNVAHMIHSERGTYPTTSEWNVSDGLSVSEASITISGTTRRFIDAPITISGSGHSFTYNEVTGTVTAN